MSARPRLTSAVARHTAPAADRPGDTPPPRHRLRAGGLLAAVLGLALVATAGAPGVLTVRKGDTLSDLAKANGTTVAELKAANGLTTDRIIAGRTLQLPGARPATTTTVTTEVGYTVVEGDNLTVIARRTGTSTATIVARNQLRSGALLPVGRTLVIPRTTRVVTGATAPTTVSTAVAAGTVAASAAQHRATLATRPTPTKEQARALVAGAAKRYGVPVPLALSVAFHESGFQQRVVSGVDAIGIMQVLPRTARNLESTAGRPLDLLKAEDNVTAGVLLLRQLLAAHGGDQAAAMAGYYQGAGSISRQGLLPQTYSYIASIEALKNRFSKG